MGKLLIVDDSKFMRGIIKKSVESLNVEIFEAENVVEAFKIIEENEIDVMTLDITMEGESGADSISGFLEKRSNLKIFVCSSMTAKGMIEKTLKDGAYDFIKKPFDNKALAEKIKRALN